MNTTGWILGQYNLGLGDIGAVTAEQRVLILIYSYCIRPLRDHGIYIHGIFTASWPWPADETSPRCSSAWSRHKQKHKKRKRNKTRRKTPSLSSRYRRRSGSLLPSLLLPLACGPACLRLGVANAPANKDVDAHTPAPGNIGPGWDAASRPHLLLPLPFPPLPFHRGTKSDLTCYCFTCASDNI
jgi:hypothetical protein